MSDSLQRETLLNCACLVLRDPNAISHNVPVCGRSLEHQVSPVLTLAYRSLLNRLAAGSALLNICCSSAASAREGESRKRIGRRNRGDTVTRFDVRAVCDCEIAPLPIRTQPPLRDRRPSFPVRNRCPAAPLITSASNGTGDVHYHVPDSAIVHNQNACLRAGRS